MARVASRGTGPGLPVATATSFALTGVVAYAVVRCCGPIRPVRSHMPWPVFVVTDALVADGAGEVDAERATAAGSPRSRRPTSRLPGEW